MNPKRLDGQPVAAWIVPKLLHARAHGWTGRVRSGWRSPEEQRRLWDEYQAGRHPGPVARPGTSNHEGLRWPRGAVDVSEPEELAAVLQRHPPRGRALRWYGPGDRWHFSATGR